MLHYFPSCHFVEIDKTAARMIREYAKQSGMAIRGCCRFDKTELHEDDCAVYMCQLCRENEEKRVPSTMSIWQIINEDKSFSLPDYSGLHVTIQDCWRDRNHPEIHDAVRSLLTKMGIAYEEIQASRTESDFCGTLHYESKKYPLESFDHLSHLENNLPELLMQEQVEHYPTELSVCYCNRCYNGILLGGGHPIHLMSLLMGTYTL